MPPLHAAVAGNCRAVKIHGNVINSSLVKPPHHSCKNCSAAGLEKFHEIHVKLRGDLRPNPNYCIISLG